MRIPIILSLVSLAAARWWSDWSLQLNSGTDSYPTNHISIKPIEKKCYKLKDYSDKSFSKFKKSYFKVGRNMVRHKS